MDDWVTAACAELGLDPAEVPVPAVLDLARDVAHQVVRPGAPVTAYLLGVAVGGARTRRTRPPGSASSPPPGRPLGADPAGSVGCAAGRPARGRIAAPGAVSDPGRGGFGPGRLDRVALTDGGDHDGRHPRRRR